jgi:hypothetical protein
MVLFWCFMACSVYIKQITCLRNDIKYGITLCAVVWVQLARLQIIRSSHKKLASLNMLSPKLIPLKIFPVR